MNWRNLLPNLFSTDKINYKNFYKLKFFSIFFICISFIVSLGLAWVTVNFPKFTFLDDPTFIYYFGFFVLLPLGVISGVYMMIYFNLIDKIKRDHPLIRKLDLTSGNDSKISKSIKKQYGYIINFPLENESNLDKFIGDLNLLREEERLYELLENHEKQDYNPEVKLTALQSEQLLRIDSLTSGRESIDLVIGIIVSFIGLFFVDVLTGNNLPFIALFVVLAISYAGHELAHKYSGNEFGIYSRFMLSELLIIIITFVSIGGIKFPFVGSVKTMDKISDKQIKGKIAFTATLYNIGLIVIGFILLIFIRTFSLSYFETFFIVLINVNIIVAILTLLPLMDGLNILDWSFKIWIMLTLFVVLIVVLQYFYLHRMFYDFSNL